MSDIHQEWRELRKKNGDFICHLDGEMAKLKWDKQLQDLADIGAFAMQFVAPPPFNCCQNDRDILKALNKAQADRIETLEKEIIARKEQEQIDLAVKKDLDEKLDKVTADYRALWVENQDLKTQLAGAKAQCENTVENRRRISELSQEVIDLRTEVHKAQVAKDRMGYSNRCMQSKIAKQSNEIKRLTHENVGLVIDMKRYKQVLDTSLSFAEIKRLTEENKQLHKALDIAAKDADANFERGKIKGMKEIWDELRACYDGRPIGESQKIFGYNTVGDMLLNLSPTWFMNKAEEYHKQKEQQTKDIQIGDEVEVINNPDSSVIGIVIGLYPQSRTFEVIGQNFTGCFDELDIQDGTVKKTGRHFDSIPLDYFK